MRYLAFVIALVSLAGAAYSGPCAFKVGTVHGVNQFVISDGGNQLLYNVQPRNSMGWYWVNNNGSPFGALATGGLGPNGWRDGSKTFAATNVAYGAPLNTIKLVFTYYMPVGSTWNYPSTNFFITDGLGRYGIWAPASGGVQYFTSVRNGDWMTMTMDLTDGNPLLVDTLGGFAIYEHNGFTNDFSQPFTLMQWGGIKNYRLAGFSSYQRSPATGWGNWGGAWDKISDAWCPFVIRNGSTSGLPPQITGIVSGGVPALEFIISEGGMKAAWGTKALDGKKVRDIAGYLERYDDPSRFTPGSGPAVAPYINIWVTDGSGKYAVIGNEPSNAEWTSVPGSSRNFDWDCLKTKTAKAYENSDKTWLPNNGVGLTFNDLADYMILAPTPAELAAGWAGLGGGAPRELVTNKAYGFNWVFGDTLSNYVSGDDGYIVANPAVREGGPEFNEYGITLNWGDTVCSAGSGYDLYQRLIKDVFVTVGGSEYNAVFEADQSAPNCLRLVPTDASIYIQPGESILVDMNVENLQQKVNACQAMLGYSSTYFANPTGATVQVPGSGPWDQVIWDSWVDGTGAPGEIDTAVGVNAQGLVGTDVDATVCKITLTSRTGVEGVTQMVFRPDLAPDPGLVKSTFLSDMSGSAVWPAKVNSTNIYIDGTAPTMESITPPEGTCIKGTRDFVFDFADANPLAYLELDITGPGYQGAGRIQVTLPARDLTEAEALQAAAMGATVVYDSVLQKWTVSLNTACGIYPDGEYNWYIEVADMAGNHWGDMDAPLPETTYTYTYDNTAPVIGVITATQGGADVLCPNLAVQGVVDIYVSATDAGCAGMTTPTVAVAGIGTASYIGGTAPYHYQVTVLSTTANGSHTITVTAADTLGNTAADSSKAICVDKNQITGQVELQSFLGSSRAVTFVATGGTTKTWTQTLSFSGGVAGYTLTNVPAGTTGLSAKTAWSLRNKLAVSLDGDNQAAVNFTGAEKILGGDLNGSNSVNVLDYSVMKTSWGSGTAGDIDGDGSTWTLDYSIMKSNWFRLGDPQ